MYQQVLAEFPDNAKALHLLGLSYFGESNWRQGVRLILRAISLQSTIALYHYNLGVAYRDHGDFEASRACFRDALALNPGYGQAWEAVVEGVRYAEGGEDLACILREIEGSEDVANLRYLDFAAGKILDDTGDYDRAFAHFQSGNQRSPADWDAQRFRASCRAIREATPRAFFESRSGWGVADAQPLFIVGMPHSGSSLVEQILATHPEVVGLGEIAQVKIIARGIGERLQPARGYPDSLALVPQDFFVGFGGAYLEEVSSMAGADTLRTVDKTLSNFLFVAVIRLMYPTARIVHCLRHPLDTCLSCWKNKPDRRTVGSYWYRAVIKAPCKMLTTVRIAKHISALDTLQFAASCEELRLRDSNNKVFSFCPGVFASALACLRICLLVR
jgi:tetratricopeptide (TPR) repeat protein